MTGSAGQPLTSRKRSFHSVLLLLGELLVGERVGELVLGRDDGRRQRLVVVGRLGVALLAGRLRVGQDLLLDARDTGEVADVLGMSVVAGTGRSSSRSAGARPLTRSAPFGIARLSFQRMPPASGMTNCTFGLSFSCIWRDVAGPGDRDRQVAGGERVVVLVAVVAAELVALVRLEQHVLGPRHVVDVASAGSTPSDSSVSPNMSRMSLNAAGHALRTPDRAGRRRS